MREPNFSNPAQNRATVVISSTLYDRRALDCTATLPLVNSLTHLAYMTSTSSRIREILAADGGLERLVKILANCQHTDKHSLWKWSLAFQCVVNVGVRGTEAIRTRVVETGTVHVVLAILENFLKALEQARTDNERDQRQQQQQLQPPAPSLLPITTATAGLVLPVVPPTQSRSTPIITSTNTPSCSPRRMLYTGAANNNNNDSSSSSSSNINNNNDVEQRLFTMAPKRRTFLTRSPRPKSKPVEPSLSSILMLSNLSADDVLHREDDILLSLQLLAYLSKYPHIRESFHKNYPHNVFSVVEKFTHRFHPTTVIYWAGVIMRNACRKDEARGGIRQCAYMHCGKWERFPREFAKCRRCRKAKYCSKQCQSKAWAEGHRWWCVERHHAPATTATMAATASAVTITTVTTATPVAATTAIANANTAVTATATTIQQPQPQQQQDPLPPVDADQMMRLDPSTTSAMLTIPLDQRPTSDMDEDLPFAPTDHHRRLHHHATVAPEQRHRSAPEPSRPSSSSHLADQSRRDHRRRNSRLTHSVPSGSSTEAEAEVEENETMMMVID